MRGDCIRARGKPNRRGYVYERHDDKVVLAHRHAWEAKHGPIPAGHEIHHRCHNRACIRLSHLRLVTKAQHRALHVNRRTCRNGHPRTRSVPHPSGSGRRCLDCLRDWTAERRKVSA